jgi:hypothetical protein
MTENSCTLKLEIKVMMITRTSIASGVTRTMDIPITEAQMHLYINGTLIQKAMPNLTADEREFILTGMTSEEWEMMENECDDQSHQWDEEVAF